MNVGELISLLSEMPAEKRVMISTDGRLIDNADGVEMNEDGEVVIW